MTVATYETEPFAPETETRVARFSDLVATTIANTEARKEVERPAEAQAALRRVATLVAKEASLPEVFARVAEEASRSLGHTDRRLWRDVGDGTATLVAVAGSGLGPAHGVGLRRATGGDSTIGRALHGGRPSRVDDYATARGSSTLARSLGLRASLACPIFVGDRAWGAMQVVSEAHAPIPLEVKMRIMRFSELVATAIANTEARAEVERLAEERAALRRCRRWSLKELRPPPPPTPWQPRSNGCWWWITSWSAATSPGVSSPCSLVARRTARRP